jgi:hypothetical protein
MSKTLVTFLLDRTGSMNQIRDDTIGAFNAYLETLQETSADVFFSLLTFDSMSLDKLHVNQPVKDIPQLTRENYIPRASTPLIDASYKTIKAVEKSINGGDTKIVICIQTDGEENASTEYTWDQLNALIKEKSDAGWQFNFMGAGIDAYKQGQRMGISADQTMSYDASDVVATRSAFRASAGNTMSYAAGVSANTSYSVQQKAAAGDKFAKKADAVAAAPIAPAIPRQKTKIVDDITL